MGTPLWIILLVTHNLAGKQPKPRTPNSISIHPITWNTELRTLKGDIPKSTHCETVQSRGTNFTGPNHQRFPDQ